MTVGTVASAVVALVALGVSVAAFRRSGLPDRRAHEFSDVRWRGYWKTLESGDGGFHLVNGGESIAKEVWVSIPTGTGDAKNLTQLRSFRPKEERLIYTINRDEHDAATLLLLLLDLSKTEGTVHWRTKLGTPMEASFEIKLE